MNNNVRNAKISLTDKDGKELEVYEGAITDLYAKVESSFNDRDYSMYNQALGMVKHQSTTFLTITVVVNNYNIIPESETPKSISERPAFKVDQIKEVEL